jgi:hypothetical protein
MSRAPSFVDGCPLSHRISGAVAYFITLYKKSDPTRNNAFGFLMPKNALHQRWTVFVSGVKDVH